MMSKIMYAAPTWQVAMEKITHRNRLLSVQRIAALRITSAYRTVSTSAALVLASIPPIDLLVSESRERYDRSREGVDIADIRRSTREDVLRHWQTRWRVEETGRWTHRIIGEIEPWVNRGHGEVSFYLTQALTGHGSFKAYLYRFKRALDPKCEFCAGDYNDDAEHTFFECERWADLRLELSRNLQIEIEPENLLSCMLRDQDAWKRIVDYVTTILKDKENVLRNTGAQDPEHQIAAEDRRGRVT